MVFSYFTIIEIMSPVELNQFQFMHVQVRFREIGLILTIGACFSCTLWNKRLLHVFDFINDVF